MTEKASEMVERVAHAIGRVSIVFSSGGHTGGEMCWCVWDRNRDTSETLGWVFVGPKANLRKERLGNPPFAVDFAHKRAVASAAIAAMREPTRAMLDAHGACDEPGGPGYEPSPAGAAQHWHAMIDEALKHE